MSQTEIVALIDRLERSIDSDIDSISPEDVRILLSIVRGYFHIQERLQANDLTMRKLRKLVGIVASTEKTRSLFRGKDQGNGSEEEEASSPGAPRAKGTPHGKSGADEYKDAKIEHHSHTNHIRGETCSECLAGKLYRFEPSQFVRISGHAPLQATVHVSEQLRCNHCQKVYGAPLPAEVVADGVSGQRFGFSAIAVVALLKYGAGTPFYRQQELQKLLAVPVTVGSHEKALVFDVSRPGRFLFPGSALVIKSPRPSLRSENC